MHIFQTALPLSEIAPATYAWRCTDGALLERAQQTDDPEEASELVKQAADILALVVEVSASDIPTVGVH